MQISEPTTTLTDYALCVLALWWGRRLLLEGVGAGRRSQVFLGSSFLALALSAFLGGTAHGFAIPLGGPGRAIIWRATMAAIGLTSFLFLGTAAYSVLAGALRRALLALAGLELLLYWGWIFFVDDDFRWALYDYVPAMLLTALLLGLLLRRSPTTETRDAARWLLAGILASFAGAAVQASGFSLHRHFNHNDLYHVIQMGALYLLYRGGRLLRDA